jgi:hypothetical protein
MLLVKHSRKQVEALPPTPCVKNGLRIPLEELHPTEKPMEVASIGILSPKPKQTKKHQPKRCRQDCNT